MASEILAMERVWRIMLLWNVGALRFCGEVVDMMICGYALCVAFRYVWRQLLAMSEAFAVLNS